MRKLINRIKEWYHVYTYYPADYHVSWNYIRWDGRVVSASACFETERQLDRFCRKIQRERYFVGFVDIFDAAA